MGSVDEIKSAAMPNSMGVTNHRRGKKNQIRVSQGIRPIRAKPDYNQSTEYPNLACVLYACIQTHYLARGHYKLPIVKFWSVDRVGYAH